MKKLSDENSTKLSERMFNSSIDAIPQMNGKIEQHRIYGVEFEEALTRAIRENVYDYQKAGSKTVSSVIAELFKSGRNDFLAKHKDC